MDASEEKEEYELFQFCTVDINLDGEEEIQIK